MAFLLQHSESNKTLIFDLGVRKDWENYPPIVVNMIKRISYVEIPFDVVDSLHRGGLEPDQVDFIVLSHIHWDHIGDPNLFPTSHFVVGAGSEALLSKGYIACDTPSPACEPEFAKGSLPSSRTTYISNDDWEPIGPFPRTHDFFGDGSVYLIDAPGHLEGHLNVLVRTSADGSWIYLGGDSAHDTRIISGERDIAMFPHPGTGALICMHRDLELAKENVRRIRKLSESPRVLILMAHDWKWYEYNKGKGVLFPGRIKPL
ncbi:Metallo-hydrolase/oxidoreductase [Ramaria rubella]|nr:Metallo-hydrolase/oxidoreductase [Ramaria rubella]